MTGSRSRHQRRCAPGAPGRQQIFIQQNRESVRTSTARVCIWKFLVRCILWQDVFFVRRAVWDRPQVFTPQWHPPRPNESRVPPPPPGGLPRFAFAGLAHRVTYLGWPQSWSPPHLFLGSNNAWGPRVSRMIQLLGDDTQSFLFQGVKEIDRPTSIPWTCNKRKHLFH